MDNNMDELGRLFLGDVRRGQTGGQPLPRRKGPHEHTPDISIDLTPEEFAGMCREENAGESLSSGKPTLRAVIGPHLNGRQSRCVRLYARHEASNGGRVGLIELDAGLLKVSCFEDSSDSSGSTAPLSQVMNVPDARSLLEALREMNWDVRLWVLSIPNPRSAAARDLLKRIDHWVLLATCDHDGVVGAYRTMKGLRQAHRPHVDVALLDVSDPNLAGHVFEKLSGVCRQFLDWPVDHHLVLADRDSITEQPLLMCEAHIDGAVEMAHGDTIAQFIEGLEHPQKPAGANVSHTAARTHETSPSSKRVVAEVVLPTMLAATETMPEAATPIHDPVCPTPDSAGSRHVAAVAQQAADFESDIIELSAIAGPDGLLEAILRHQSDELACCVVRPPMCDDARLAVSRDHRLTVVAAARGGLANLRAIGQAYRWAVENRQLIAMAMPQMALDALLEPALRLFVDHADLSAQVLTPLLQSQNVRVWPYRKLRWGQRLGLLLEAA